MNAAHRLLARLSLPQQAWLVGGVASAASAAAWAGWAGWAGWAAWQMHATPPGAIAEPGWWAAAAAGLVATAATAWAAGRAQRAHGALGAAARAIAREAPGGEAAALPLRTDSADLLDSSAALRRAVESLRARIDTLAAQNDALTARLSLRTQELTSLQDLSIGLALRGDDVAGLVEEALHALERTMAYSSASVWAREHLDPAQPVALLGYRSSATELTGLALSDLAGLRLSRANLQRYEQIESRGEAIVENHPQQGLLAWLWAMVTDDARTSALYRSTRSWMAVPLAVRGAARPAARAPAQDGGAGPAPADDAPSSPLRVLGVLRVDHTEPGHFTEERTRLLAAVASQTALAMRQAHLAARERDNAIAAERNRLARDLHDAVSQTLFAANLVAGTLNKDPELPAGARAQAGTLQRLNHGALAEMRMLMFELRPDALAALPLAELLQQAAAALAARGEIEMQVQVDAVDPPPQVRIELYRIAQEALSNIARHSGAHEVQVRWRVQGSSAAAAPRGEQTGRLVICDDGHGFDTAAAPPGHFGLVNMRERAAALGGTLAVHSAAGAGTRIECEVTWSVVARGAKVAATTLAEMRE